MSNTKPLLQDAQTPGGEESKNTKVEVEEIKLPKLSYRTLGETKPRTLAPLKEQELKEFNGEELCVDNIEATMPALSESTAQKQCTESMFDTPYDKYIDPSQTYFDQQKPDAFIQQLVKKLTLGGIYKLEHIYHNDAQSPLCPILIKYGEELYNQTREPVVIKNFWQTVQVVKEIPRYLLQIWDRKGSIVWEKAVKKPPKAATFSCNSRYVHIDPENQQESPAESYTFVYVQDKLNANIEVICMSVDQTQESKPIKMDYLYRIKDTKKLFEQENDLSSGSFFQSNEINSDPILKRQRQQSFGVHQSKGKPRDCIGLTKYNVLIVCTKDAIYYTSLTKSFADNDLKSRGQVEGQIDTGIKANMWSRARVNKDKIVKGIQIDCEWKTLRIPIQKEVINGFEEQKEYSIRGIYEDKIETTPSAANPRPRSEYPLVLLCDYEHTTQHKTSFSTKQIKYRSHMCFMKVENIFVTTDQEVSEDQKSYEIKLKPKFISDSLTQAEQTKRVGLLDVKKIRFIGVFDQNQNNFKHYTVCQNGDNSIDLYFNCVHVDMIPKNYEHKKAALTESLTFSDFTLTQQNIILMGRHYGMQHRFKKGILVKVIKVFQKIHDDAKLENPDKDTGFEVFLSKIKKEMLASSHLFEIKLKHGKRMGSQTLELCEFRGSKQKMIEQSTYGRITSYYKPFTSFQQCFRSFVCSHNAFLSWKPFGQPKWKHFFFQDKNQSLIKIKNIFINKGSLEQYTQLTVLREDGQLLRMKFGGENGKQKFMPKCFEDAFEENKVREKIRQIVTDDVMRKHHLILTNNQSIQGFNEQKIYMVNQGGKENQFLEDITELLAQGKVIRQDPKLRQEIVQIVQIFSKGGPVKKSSDIEDKIDEVDYNDFAVLKKDKEGKISAALFRLTDYLYTEEQKSQQTRHLLPQVELIGRFDIPFLNFKSYKGLVTTLQLTQIHQSILNMSEEHDFQKRSIKSWILTDEKHWLHLTLNKKLDQQLDTEIEYEIDNFTAHLGIGIRRFTVVDDFIYTIHDDTSLSKVFFPKIEALQEEEEFKDQISITTPRDVKTVDAKTGVGLLNLKAYMLNSQARPQIVPLSEAVGGVNSSIVYAETNNSLLYMRNYDQFEYLPLPHRCTIPLEKSYARKCYIMHKQIDNFFIALGGPPMPIQSDTGTRKVPMQFFIWQMQNGLQVKEFDPENKSQNILSDQFEEDCENQYRSISKHFVSFKQPDPEKDPVFKDISSGKWKVWVGKDPSKCYNREMIDLEGEKCSPGFWQQGLFDYTLIYKDNNEDPQVVKKQPQQNAQFDVSKAIQQASKKLHCALVKIKLKITKVPYICPIQNIHKFNVLLEPQLQMLFDFKWDRKKGEQFDDFADIFFNKFNPTKLHNVKLLEIQGSQYKIYTMVEEKKEQFSEIQRQITKGGHAYTWGQINVPRMVVAENGLKSLDKFPHEIVDNPFNAYDKLSGDFLYYIDYCSSRKSFVISETETGNVRYSFSKKMLNMSQNDIDFIRLSLKFITWAPPTMVDVTNPQGQKIKKPVWDHVQIAHPYNNHQSVKMLKVIYADQKGEVFGEENFEEKIGGSLPFLKQVSKRNPKSEIWNYFKGQTALPLDDIPARYMRKHNQFKGYLHIQRKIQLIAQETETQNYEKYNNEDVDKYGYDFQKSAQLKKQCQETLTQLNNKLFTIDYFANERYTIELSFSAYDWSLMSTLRSVWNDQVRPKQKNITDDQSTYIDNLLCTRSLESLLMILPRGNTLLHSCINEVEFMKFVVGHAQSQKDEHGDIVEIPFIKDFRGKSPLHLALADEDDNPNGGIEGSVQWYKDTNYPSSNETTASFFLQMLQPYSLDQHSRSVRDILPECIARTLDHLPEYLRSRKLQPTYLKVCKYIEGYDLQCGDDDDDQVAVGPATIWESQDGLQARDSFLEKSQNNNNQQTTSVCFFSILDFPQLNDLREGSQADEFMNSLAQITDNDQENAIFKIDTIQAAIDYRWRIVKPYAIWKNFVPYLVYLFTYLFYIFNITNESKEGCACLQSVTSETTVQTEIEGTQVLVCPETSQIMSVCLMIARVVLLLCSFYLLLLEMCRMRRSGFCNYWFSQKGYLMNWIIVIPNLSILAVVGILSMPLICPGMWLYSVNGISFFFLSLRIIYFLGFSRETAKFTKVLSSVGSELVIFIVVLVLLCFMFVVPFMMLDKGNRKLRTELDTEGDDMFLSDVNGPSDMTLPLIQLYMVAIGEYGMIGGFQGDDVMNYYAAIIIFFFVTLLIQMVMMNLIISIIDQVYQRVNDNIEASIYAVRVNNVCQNMHLVPNQTIQTELKKGRFIVTAEKFDFDKAEIAQVADEIQETIEQKAAKEGELEDKLDQDRFKEIKDDKIQIAQLEEQLEGLHKHFISKNKERDPDWVEEE